MPCSWVFLLVLSGVGLRQREARATLALLKVLPTEVNADLFDAVV